MGNGLPQRQQEILRLAASGMTDKEIASALGISRDTVASHWKRIRQTFDLSSRTAIIAQVIGKGGLAEGAHVEPNRLLYEMAVRDRTQAELEEANAKLQKEIEKRTQMLAQARQEADRNRSQIMARLEYLEELNSLLTQVGIVPNLGEHSGSWRKTWVAESISAWGYTPEQATSGEITPMNTLEPEDIVHSLRGTEKVRNGQSRIALSHRVICADGSRRVILDLVRAEPVGPDGIGRCVMVAIDITEFVDEIKNLIRRGWPDLPLQDS